MEEIRTDIFVAEEDRKEETKDIEEALSKL